MSLLWDKLLRPMAFRMEAEHAHELGIKALETGLAAPFYGAYIDPILSCERFGLQFKSPLGVAAGFDKNGLVTEPLARLGFGFVEVGTVTARPQPGNPKPRLFRLPDDQALINRLGFNNDGAVVVAERLRTIDRNCVVGVNIGRNKEVPNKQAIDNYLQALEAVWTAADYIAVNVSSPNTVGLRDLQQSENLDELLCGLQQKNAELSTAHGHPLELKPLLVKIAPDLGYDDVSSITQIAMKNALSGIVVANTTISREGLSGDASRFGAGGLSGAPLRQRSNDMIRRIYEETGGDLAIIGVGGIFSPEDAFEKIAAGARLVQAYTGFVYRGPTFPSKMNKGLARMLRERGFNSVDEAVGSAAN